MRTRLARLALLGLAHAAGAWPRLRMCAASTPGPTDAAATAALMTSCNRRGQHAAALDAFEGAAALDAACYVEAMRAYGRRGESAKALDALAAMQSAGYPPSVVAFDAAIRACASQKHWPVALSLLEDLRDSGLCADAQVYNAALVACERGAQWDEARLLLDEMVKLGVADVFSYNTAIATASRAGKWQEAERLLAVMSEGEGISPDAYSYSATISALDRGGQGARALQLFAKMQAQGVSPTVVTYNTAIRACASTQAEDSAGWPVALSLLDDMRDDGLAPNLYTFNGVIAACATGGAWEEALLLLQEMDECDGVRADATSYHSAIAACRRDGTRAAARAAVKLLQRMRRRRLPTSLIGFTTAMNALGQAGYQLGALAVMQRIHGAGLRPDDTATHSALIACAATGRFKQASTLIEQLSTPTREAYQSLASAALASGESDAVVQALRERAAEMPSLGRSGRARGRGRGGLKRPGRPAGDRRESNSPSRKSAYDPAQRRRPGSRRGAASGDVWWPTMSIT